MVNLNKTLSSLFGFNGQLVIGRQKSYFFNSIGQKQLLSSNKLACLAAKFNIRMFILFHLLIVWAIALMLQHDIVHWSKNNEKTPIGTSTQ